MKPILIIKTGSTFPEISKDRGDFEDWIIAGMGIDRKKFLIVNVSRGELLPGYDEISGIVITGSHAMVTDHADWSERTAEWLPGAVAKEIPLLGICYGHQLLAHAMGGEVGDNPNGLEFGTVEAHLTEIAQKDRLFSFLPAKVHLQATHTQSVIKLPPGAKLLAATSMDKNHAFVIGDCTWGIQFHPEFDMDIVKRYIGILRDYLQSKGLQPDELIKNCFETAFGERFLKRFAEIATGVNK
jgi:GMP synthase (glutamine-hydrolysing)